MHKLLTDFHSGPRDFIQWMRRSLLKTSSRRHFDFHEPAWAVLFAACVWLRACSSAFAWNAEGHMVVAQIAYNHLSPEVRDKCEALIAVSLSYGSTANNTFVTAACWADDYKSQLGTAIWHYIDLPFSLDGTPTSGVIPASFDVVQAINLCVSNLQNSASTQSEQATSLRYVLHFAGDIQQPLHSSTAVSSSQPGGDAGGNGFSITGSTWNNLHSLWDAGGGYLSNSLSRPLSSTSQATLAAKVAAIEAAYPHSPNPGTIPNPMDWAQESFEVATNTAYVGITPGTSPSPSYLDSAQATTAQRMAQGGYRLADLLMTLFGSNSNPITLVPVCSTNGAFSFSWNTNSNQVYSVEWKGQLDGTNWNVLTNITASGTSASFSEPPTNMQRFYRIAQ
jgi:hypothetical protein